MNTWLTMLKRGALLALFLAAGIGAHAGEPEAGGIERQGTIHELDYGANTVVISGARYSVAIDAKVEIGGSYGAFTMLQTGMAVAYTFDRYADERVITEIKELPSGVVPEEY